MALVRFTLLLISLLFSALVFSAACPASSATTTAGNGNCTVTGSSSTIQLNFDSGFDSTTAITATGGNNGTTIGAQRKLSFIKAAEILAAQLDSTITISVDASFSALSCSSNSATLGSAGAVNNFAYNSPAPTGLVASTFYPVALINAIRNQDVDTDGNGDGDSDITAEFNRDIGDADCLAASSWYYGFGTPGGSEIGFTTVLLHEMTHGLGFASLVNPSSGAKASGIDDIFSNNLYAAANTSTWPNLSNAQRATSATSSTGLLWNGTNTNTQAIALLTDGFQDNDTSNSFTSGDRVEMYAPATVESGSSVSHFNTAAAPNELMEPSYTEGQYSLGLAFYLLQDIGWDINANTDPTITAVDQTTNEDVALVVDISGWGNDGDGDTLSYSVTTCATNITCSISGTDLTLTPDADHNGATHSITVEVDDGNGGTVSDSFNLTVTALNDAPIWTTITTQNVAEGDSVNVALASFASDVEGDTITYTVTNCDSGLTCSIAGSTLTLNAISNAGNVVSVTVQADDGNLGTTSVDIDVSIGQAGNTAPTLTAVDQNTLEDTDLVVDFSTWANDADGDTLSYLITACDANITCSIIGTNLTLAPDADQNGATHAITLQASDGNGGVISDSFNLTIAAVNDAPVITAVDQTVDEDDTLIVDISGWGSDVDGDAVTYAINTCATNITCSLSGTDLTLTPDTDHYGATHTIIIEVADGDGETDLGSLNLEVSNTSDDPLITAVDQTTNEDEALVVDISSWGSDVDDDTLSYTILTCATDITCTVVGSNLTLTPSSDHNGAVHTITVEVNDGHGNTASDSFNLDVVAQNDDPVINAISQATDEDTALVVDMSAWTSDAEGDSLTYSVTTCATNISCSIVGNNLTLTPNVNHNGTTHSITIGVIDGNGGSASDSFNLAINPVNDAPFFIAPANLTIAIDHTEVIDLAPLADDIENEALSFSVLTCNANLTCHVSGNNLSLLASSGEGTVVPVGVQVTDATGATDTHTFNVSITAFTPTLHLEVGGTSFVNGDTGVLPLSDTQVDVIGGSGNFLYDLTYNELNGNALLSFNNDGVEIALPVSGTFAGNYVFSITDNNTSEVLIVTFTRSLRITWSSTSFLNGIGGHSLIIEGGESGGQFSLSQTESGLIKFLDSNETEQTMFVAPNDAVSFNRIDIQIEDSRVLEITSVDVTLESFDQSFTDIVQTLTVYPSVAHVISVIDSLRVAIPLAQGNLASLTLLNTLGLDLQYSADQNGFINLLLPSDEDAYAFTLSAAGYNPTSINLDATLSEHQVILARIGEGIILNGSITALGSQNFVKSPPTAKLNFSEGDSEFMIVSVSDATNASFIHTVDTAIHGLQTLNIIQGDSIDHETDISALSQNETFEIELEAAPVVEESSSSSSSSGPFNPYWLFCFILLTSLRRKRSAN